MKNLLGLVSLTVALAAALFLSSGDLTWGMAWIYIFLHVSMSAISMRMIASKSPGLLEERLHPGAGVKAWDKPLANVTMLLVPVILIISGLDRHFGWSADISVLIQLVAFIIWLLAACRRSR
jgi:phosphatidylglycerophosphate synthase